MCPQVMIGITRTKFGLNLLKRCKDTASCPFLREFSSNSLMLKCFTKTFSAKLKNYEKFRKCGNAISQYCCFYWLSLGEKKIPILKEIKKFQLFQTFQMNLPKLSIYPTGQIILH